MTGADQSWGGGGRARSPGETVLWRVGRFVAAAGFTALLLLFLVASRWLQSSRVPLVEVREVETVPEVALPPPPPVAVEPAPPPPPPERQLPRLELQLEAVAPPLEAELEQTLDLTMRPAEFELQPVDRPRPEPAVAAAPAPERSAPPQPRPAPAPAPSPEPRPVPSVVAAGELDAVPRLLNRPSAAYPRSQLRRGVRQGRVVLEVAIDRSGRTTVRRVVSSTHPDFAEMARQFAARARFTRPTKNGQPVTAVYQWSLTLQP